MILPATRESADRRGFVVGSEPLFEILSEEQEREVRFRLSYRSGVSGAIMDYDKTGALPVFEAIRLANMIEERKTEDFQIYLEGVNRAFWGKN